MSSEPIVEQAKPEITIPTEDTSNPTEGTVTKIEPTVEEKGTTPVTSREIPSGERNALKEQVRQALASKATITYEEIASKLGIDEGLVSELSDEIDVGA